MEKYYSTLLTFVHDCQHPLLFQTKNPDTIIKAIFKIWILVYGSAEEFLTDNRKEFANNNFIQLSKSFGITVKTTAAESPWSNGLVE